MSSFINLGLGESMQEILFYHLLLLRKKACSNYAKAPSISISFYAFNGYSPSFFRVHI